MNAASCALSLCPVNLHVVEILSHRPWSQFHFPKMASRVCVGLMLAMLAATCAAQTPDASAIIRGVDAAVKARLDRIAQYTDTEHYKVFRGKDETHPVAEMVVKTTYTPERGKSYQVLSESGSIVILKILLRPLLENERLLNEPGRVSASWIVSANYNMTVKPGGPVMQDGQPCWQVSIHPKQKAPNLIEGMVWVDVKHDSIARLEGDSSKNPSFWAGAAHMVRQYTEIDGFSEATHARAESDSFVFGKTVVTIDYEGYQIQSR
jgi:hypothetical protein